MESDWEIYYCKSGEVLFYHNTVTGQYKWPHGENCMLDEDLLPGDATTRRIVGSIDMHTGVCQPLSAVPCLVHAAINVQEYDNNILSTSGNVPECTRKRTATTSEIDTNLPGKVMRLDDKITQDENNTSQPLSRDNQSNTGNDRCSEETWRRKRAATTSGVDTNLQGKVMRLDDKITQDGSNTSKPVEKDSQSKTGNAGCPEETWRRKRAVTTSEVDTNLPGKMMRLDDKIMEEEKSTSKPVEKDNQIGNAQCSEETPLKCQHCAQHFSSQENLEHHLQVHYKPFHCTTCGRRFWRESLLIDHTQTYHKNNHEHSHGNKKPFECLRCGQGFYHSNNLSHHLCRHPPTLFDIPTVAHGKFKDEACNVAFLKNSDLVEHIRNKHRKSNCPLPDDSNKNASGCQCDIDFDYPSHTETHESESDKIEEANSAGEFRCQECGRCYVRKCHLSRHMSYLHPDSKEHLLKNLDGKVFRCTQCDKCYNNRGSLWKHVKSHTHSSSENSGHKCRYCCKMFSSKTSLLRHTQLHKPVQGNVDANLSVNRMTSTTEGKQKNSSGKRFMCKHCGKLFNCNTSRWRHSKLHNTKLTQVAATKGKQKNSGGKFKCKYCGKLFNWDSNLYRHTQLHKTMPMQGIEGTTGGLRCTKCNKTFSRGCDLSRHVGFYHGKGHREVQANKAADGKLFKCKFCDTYFKYKRNIAGHIRRRHKTEKPFKCEFCDACFKYKRNRYTHTQLKHKSNSPKRSVVSASGVKVEENKEGNPLKCAFCDSHFTNTKSRAQHVRRKHATSSSKRRISSASDVKVEENKEGKPFECKPCGESFDYHCRLLRHCTTLTHRMRVTGQPEISRTDRNGRSKSYKPVEYKSRKPIECKPGTPLACKTGKPVKCKPEKPVKCKAGKAVKCKPEKPLACKPGNPVKCKSGKPVKCKPGQSVGCKSGKSREVEPGESIRCKSGKLFECKPCGERFKYQCRFVRHCVSLKHRVQAEGLKIASTDGDVCSCRLNDFEEGKPYKKCKKCGRSFDCYSAFINHLPSKLIASLHKCDVCRRRFLTAKGLQKHVCAKRVQYS